jgi:hypothetical protein
MKDAQGMNNLHAAMTGGHFRLAPPGCPVRARPGLARRWPAMEPPVAPSRPQAPLRRAAGCPAGWARRLREDMEPSYNTLRCVS